jgi:hypothetical protein
MSSNNTTLGIWGEGLVGAASIGVNLLLSPLLRSGRMRWGATEEEARRPLPGDEMSPHPKWVATRAVTIHAPADRVWKWLVQLGCKRGGWYSYDLLDNGGKPSVDRIEPALQNLKVGDTLPMTPDGKMAMPVREIDPGRALVLGGTIDSKTGKDGDINDPNLREYFSWVISYALRPIDANTTRLISRNHADWNPSFANQVAFDFFVETFSFVMERKMMLGIKERAERK